MFLTLENTGCQGIDSAALISLGLKIRNKFKSSHLGIPDVMTWKIK